MFGTNNYTQPYWSSALQPVGQPQQQNNNGIIWVQGEAGAKSYLVAPGQAVLLMDSESNSFYIKSSDASGMPMPLRTFDYVERTVAKEDKVQTNYVTREEFEKVIAELKDAKQSLPTAKPE